MSVMKMIFKKKLLLIIPVILVIVLGILLYFHFKDSDNTDVSINLDTSTENINWDNYSSEEITLSDDLTITKAGVYTLTGTLNGTVTINTSGNVKLILDGVTITSSNEPAIYVKNADNVVIYLENGTENTLSDSSTYTGFDQDVEGAIFSKDDLILEGEGTLILNGNKGDALVSKDDLVINSGTYIITALDDGIRGKDSVYIKGGTFTIKSVCDAIKSTNDTDTTKGFVKIEGGTFNITTTSENSGDSAKGIKAVNVVLIEGGIFNITSTDDAVHSNNVVKISGGDFEISSGDDGIHADNELCIDDGTINITKSYEGLEAEKIAINDGNISIVARDDGINASGSDKNASSISVYGGTIKVSASGDGIDSNGSIYIYGGEVYVDGPTSDGDGALDYDNELVISGGMLVAVGSSGMAQGISSSSSQYGILVNFLNTYKAGDIITIVDSDNNEVLSYTASKTFASICFSASSLQKGETYTVKVNGVSVNIVTIESIATTSGASSRNGGGPQGQG